ncbi:Sulfoquinovose isomerase [Defluviimonas aquaemixtae]|uniref:Sulfoquinovose isomerase n=1 Tax=Albidovulum aquaemixtae TaxID=1542388 RepID=A0A2R8B830_9RHOB|nr:Sulfoquinovose isomerase [Defluviimonas aquaemixtae]
MIDRHLPGPADADGCWLDCEAHRAWLAADARRQFDFFRASLNPVAGFHVLDYDGAPLPDTVQELHTTTRLVHSFALGKRAGLGDCDAVIDQGMRYLFSHHHDEKHGGYHWAMDGNSVHDGRKLAYGHVFVLLAAASAQMAGHPDAERLINDVDGVLDARFWDEEHGLFLDEWNRDWSPFSTYRGMNANMHAVEALLTAYEATDRAKYIDRAGRVLDFFLRRIAPAHDWRLPEHYTADWQVDRSYSGNPMFRPAGTTPGHSFELARLALQYWDLCGRPGDEWPAAARHLVDRALADAWDEERGGLVYTLDFGGTPAIRSRYWWPVTEAIGALAAFIKLDHGERDEGWYRRLWIFAGSHFVDHERGGWFPEIDDDGQPTTTQFKGKPDVYHSVQAALLPLVPGLSRLGEKMGSLALDSGRPAAAPRDGGIA